MNTSNEQLFSIGSVVKFTGLTSHAIRVWEKRHNAVQPIRLSNGRRMYSQADIDRLSCLKQCTDLGKSISSIAKLDNNALASCLKELKNNLPTASKLNSPSSFSGTFALFGSTEFLENKELQHYKTEAKFTDKATFLNEVTNLQPDTILMEIPSLTKRWVEELLTILTQATPDHLVVVYRFASNWCSTTLQNSGISLIRAPMTHGTLSKILIEKNAPPRFDSMGEKDKIHLKTYPKKIFTAAQLTKIKDSPNNIECECPHHIVELINGLTSFEKYSAECINENDTDAALHADIQRRTAQARHDLETLLYDVLTLENISF